MPSQPSHWTCNGSSHIQQAQHVCCMFTGTNESCIDWVFGRSLHLHPAACPGGQSTWPQGPKPAAASAASPAASCGLGSTPRTVPAACLSPVPPPNTHQEQYSWAKFIALCISRLCNQTLRAAAYSPHQPGHLDSRHQPSDAMPLPGDPSYTCLFMPSHAYSSLRALPGSVRRCMPWRHD